MPFINNKKLIALREAAKNGDERAQAILSAMRSGSKQDDLNNLITEYDKPVEPEVPQDEEIPEQTATTQPTQDTALEIPVELRSKLEEIAKANNVEVGVLINLILAKYVKEKESI